MLTHSANPSLEQLGGHEIVEASYLHSFEASCSSVSVRQAATDGGVGVAWRGVDVTQPPLLRASARGRIRVVKWSTEKPIRDVRLSRRDRLASHISLYVRKQARKSCGQNDRSVDHELDHLVRRLDPVEWAELLDDGDDLADRTDNDASDRRLA
jgi:hypothetical protein